MLKSKLVHPEILYALGRAGHGSKVLIADGDYPASTTGGKNSSIVQLNLSPGVVNCTQVLEALLPLLLIEEVAVMADPDGQSEPPVWNEYRNIIKENGYDLSLKIIERFMFYDEIATDELALIIQTGELRSWANILLTIGSL